MKNLSILLATLLLAACSGMGTYGGYDTSGSSAGTSGSPGMTAADDAWYATNPGMYRGDPTKSLYFGD
jgi:hypothetical protein